MHSNSQSSRLGDYFRPQKLILKICGISLRENESISYRLYSGFVMCMIVSLLFVEIHGIVVHIKDVENLAGFIAIVFQHVLTLFKLIILKRNRAIISETLQMLHEGCFAPNFERGGAIEEKLIKECNHDIFVRSATYYIAGAITIGNAVIIALRTKLGQDDYRLWETFWLPFELFEIKSTTCYYIVYIYCSLAITYFSTFVMVTDLLITSVIKHATTHFVILGNFIRNITKYKVEKNNDELYNDYPKLRNDRLRMRMRAAIVYHQEIIKVTERFENLFNIFILCEFVGSIFVLCGTMYKSTLYSLGDQRTIRECVFLFTMTTQLFIYCYCGNELTLSSTSVSFACYEADFIDEDLWFQKNLLMIMMRSQKPVALTAGKFTVLSLPAFVGILRVSYSSAMVLRKAN
uniref:Odorant receptor n=1 Tax=Protaetia brevitarsis TaxID=348688 RepID=A0A411HR61_PROBE|nr:odorant receptor [Protaetia brevitarsis]